VGIYTEFRPRDMENPVGFLAKIGIMAATKAARD
jgi:hypothetical protein